MLVLLLSVLKKSQPPGPHRNSREIRTLVMFDSNRTSRSGTTTVERHRSVKFRKKDKWKERQGQTGVACEGECERQREGRICTCLHANR